MRRTILVFLLVFCCARRAAGGEETLHGFVVGITPPDTIAIDDVSITSENRLSLEINAVNPGNAPNVLKPGGVRVGEEVEIRGDYKTATHQLTVKSVKILSADARQFNSTAFPDKPPELQRTSAGWTGYIFVDGMRIHVTESTSVTFRRNKTEVKESKSPDKSASAPKTASLASLDEIGPDTMAHYEGVGQKDSSVSASKVEFEHFELLHGEAKLLQKLAPTIHKGDALISQPDELEIGRTKYKLVPSQDAQDYLQKLGESLVPLHQRELPGDSALKIAYRLYLVEDKKFDVLSFPNGVILVKSGLFDGLENEAQLAYYMARGMAQVEERDIWHLSRHFAPSGKELAIAAAEAGFGAMGAGILAPVVVYAVAHDKFVESLTDQSDRLALKWMLSAGYDIREAPRVYKAYALTHPDHTPISPKTDANQTEKNDACAERRSFLMTELRTNYSQTSYSSLKKDSDQFHTVAREAHKSER